MKTITNTKIALLTNGSLLWREDVRNRITGADIVIPTLSTVFEETFKTIHRPHEALDLTRIIEGLKYFRQIYKGKIFLEVVLLAGLNQSSKEIEGLKGVIDEISPDRIQLNTVVRPPADSRAIPLDKRGLEDIKDYFGENADIITSIPFKQKEGQYNSLIDTVLEMARRRPIKAMDVAHALNMGLEEIEGIIKGLLIKGSLHQQEHSGEVFYVKAHGAKQMI
ncbi:MAG: hypothetical protein SV375_18790 [Thermodesulfobacteriota bacterium]|nr:hypothetical protein [Thermodesulfobacteriota bacterium]